MTIQCRHQRGKTVLFSSDGYGVAFRRWPAVVVSDSDDGMFLYTPEHAPYLRLMADDDTELPRVLGPRTFNAVPKHHVVRKFGARSRLIVARPGDAHAVFIEWAQPGWKHREWYVNFQQPLERTSDGFRTTDFVLDLVVHTDRTWQWKDVDELHASVDIGRLTEGEVAEILRHAESVRVDVESWGWPFSAGYENWRPPDDLPGLDIPAALEMMRKQAIRNPRP